MSLPVQRINSAGDRHAVVERLRGLLPHLESRSGGMVSLGVAEIDRHLPQGGLKAGLLHEFTATAAGDMPAAFGFVIALLGLALGAAGSGLLVLSRRSLAAFGMPYGHGLAGLGLSPERLLLVETASDPDALWAVEEALRLRAVGGLAAWIGTPIGLKASRRLQVAGEGSGAMLFILRPPEADEANAAATRWRIGAAPAARDRFGCFSGRRWQVALERCRNGRPGAWIVEFGGPEWSHGAHPFGLVGRLADAALPRRAGPEPRPDPLRHAG